KTCREINIALEKYAQTSPLNAVSNSYLQAKLKEAKLLINLYSNDVNKYLITISLYYPVCEFSVYEQFTIFNDIN
ncbi:MAG: hypothetical protein LBG77_04320, partial [Dysgonamonadaceae bacterium]|nr:hypothetical protein [Dysgonamonadaceae bacterium]